MSVPNNNNAVNPTPGLPGSAQIGLFFTLDDKICIVSNLRIPKDREAKLIEWVDKYGEKLAEKEGWKYAGARPKHKWCLEPNLKLYIYSFELLESKDDDDG